MGRRSVVVIIATLILILTVPPFVVACAAQETGTDVLGDDVRTFTGVVDTVEVVADRPEPLETLSTFATVHKISAAGGLVTSVADIIESGAGTHIQRYGGVGSYSTASIRASSPGQVEVYMDGVPLMSGQWGATNLADLPLDGLERIEVYRGGAPVDFGTPGVGGVVNLVTRPTGTGHVLASVSGGSHGTWKVDLLRSGSVGDSGDHRGFGYSASVHYLRSDGDFEFLDRHGTPENPEDDEIIARENNAFQQSDLMLRVTPPDWCGWKLDLADDVFTKESGIPGIESVHLRSVRYEIIRNIARATVSSPLLRDAFEFKTTAFHQHRRDLFFNPEDEIGFNRSDTDNLSRAYGVNALTTAHWHAARQVVRLFAETRRERFTPEDKNPNVGEGFTRLRSSMSLSLEDKLFVGRSLEVSGGYRLQEAVDNYSGPVPFGQPPVARDDPHWVTFHGPTLGFRWNVRPGVTFRGNRTHYARFPSMIELFGASGTVEGNPELAPEEGTTADVGVELTFRFGRAARWMSAGAASAGPASAGAASAGKERATPGSARVEAVLFRADREQLIAFLQNSQRTVKAFNLESARVEGLELSASGSLGRKSWRTGRVDLTASYTLQDARNTGPSPVYHDRRLPYEPEHSLFLRTSWSRGRVGLWHEYRFESESYRDRANLPENLSPDRHLNDVGVAVEVVRDLVTLRGEVSNLLDERVVDVEGYPLPGRTYMLGMEITPGR